MSALYTVLRSDRRTLALEVKADGSVIVRAPRRMPQARIEAFVAAHDGWIEKSVKAQKERAARHPDPEGRAGELRQKAAEILPGKVEYFARLTGLTPASVRVTGAKTRFGSCSPRNGLCFSYRLMDYPEDAIDYVVLHEICHIRHKNHSAAFYALIARFMPDYKNRAAMLKK